MIAALLIAASVAVPAKAAAVKLFAYDEKGAPLTLPGLLARLARADDKNPDPEKPAFWAFPVDEKAPPSRVKLAQAGPLLTATWEGGPARFELVWPVKEDGYSQVGADNGGNGFTDGAAVFLDEEIALTQYRLFKESWKRRTTDWQPLYEPGRKAKSLADDAKKGMADAERVKEAPKRAAAFEDALRRTALAWEKELYEHGLQLALDARRAKNERFGLTFDDSLISKRMDDIDWLAEAAQRSGSDWVRVVFRPNGEDFEYASLRSFNEYDGVLKELRKRNLKVIGSILDTTQWPKTLTPEAYAERVKNIVLHYKGQISSWEIGSEINGDWLGGASEPLSLDQVFKIYMAGAAKAKELDPETETMATLYWWEATAPDRAHSLSGWLKRYTAQGFGKNADMIGVELYPEDNPVGMALERSFDTVADALPQQKLMLSSFGYVEKDQLKGYWWLAPDDVDGGRKDLLILYTVASCAMRSSVCGGFWWQTLDQMLPVGHHKATELFKVDVHTLTQLGRKEK
ncbi:MAG TPA: hypothetical protein VN915_13130 [Elusimicrobiota bacterium]|nr:hypothetical protein [Elusimicrobiota bacterium]